MNTIELKTIGADVEMFLTNTETGEVVSAENIVKGSKYDPFHFDANNKWFTTSLDNVLAEITIPPAKTARQFSTYLRKSMAYVKSILPKELDLLITPSASLDSKWLLTENAQTFG